jgi:hypothetical protein
MKKTQMRSLLLIVALTAWTRPGAAQTPGLSASSPLFVGVPTPRWSAALEAQPDTAGRGS